MRMEIKSSQELLVTVMTGCSAEWTFVSAEHPYLLTPCPSSDLQLYAFGELAPIDRLPGRSGDGATLPAALPGSALSLADRGARHCQPSASRRQAQVPA